MSYTWNGIEMVPTEPGSLPGLPMVAKHRLYDVGSRIIFPKFVSSEARIA